MKKVFGLVAVLVMLVSVSAFAQEERIAKGKSPEGKTFFLYKGLVQKQDSGWQENGIGNGLFEVVINEGLLDVRFVDAAERIVSSRADGGVVQILNKGENEVSVLVYYPGNAIEVYTFYTDNDGKNKFTLTQVRGGPSVLLPQSSIFSGDCDYIDFDKFPEPS